MARNEAAALLEHYQDLAKLDRAALIERLDAQADDTRQPAKYGPRGDLAEIHRAASDPARFYFAADRLQVIYLRDAKRLGSLDEETLRAALPGAPDAELRSRAGKRSEKMVWATHGVAFSAGDRIDFVEFFPPRTVEEYQRTLHVEPGPFRK